MNPDIGRRSFLSAAGALGLLTLLPGCGSSTSLSPAASGERGRFLDAHELDTLRAVTARLIPGPPDDPAPGAREAGAAEAIDSLLGAFISGVPPIHAGGPFSDRAGSTHDDFADFVPLDAQAELGWRIRIEGSKGLPEREFAGPVVGLQDVYRNGLAHLDARAQQFSGKDFVDLSGVEQDLLLLDLTDGDTQAFVGAAFANTLEAVYGAPEYGGNRNLAGWSFTQWGGDNEPTGFTDVQVSTPGPASGAIGPSAIAQVEKFLGAMSGRRATRDAFWLGHRGFAKR